VLYLGVRQRPRGLIGVATAVLLAGACGNAGITSVHGAADALPAAAVVKTPPSVFVASSISLPVMSVTARQPSSYIRAVATVYQPSADGDGTATPLLAAMFAPGEDCCISFPGLRGVEVDPPFHGLHVQGRTGAIGKLGKDELVVWTTPATSQEADEAAVLGAGVTDAQVRRAAGGARADAHSASVAAAALPTGYRPVASGPIAIGADAMTGAFGVRYGNITAYLQVETAAGGADLFAMARATTAGQAVEIGGHPVWAGPAVGGDAQLQRYVWRDGGDVVAVDARGLPDQQVRAVIASLRREPTSQALRELRARIGHYPVQQLTHPGEEVAVSVPVGHGVFVVTLASVKGGDKLLLNLDGVGLPPDAAGGSSGWPAVQNRASWDSLGTGSAVVFGSTPLRAASVWLRAPNGKMTRATLGHAASQPELTFFAVVVPENGRPPSYTVTARDNRNGVLGSWHVT
jgi:hypothetical protein